MVIMILVTLYLGVPKESIYEQFTNTFMLKRSAVGTLPFAVDDPASKPSRGRDLNEIVVDLFNKGKSASLRQKTTPRRTPLCSTPPRQTPLCSTPPRRTPLCSTTPRRTPLCSTPPRRTPLCLIPPRRTPLKLTPPRRTPLWSTSPRRIWWTLQSQEPLEMTMWAHVGNHNHET